MAKVRGLEKLISWDKAMEIIVAMAGDEFNYVYGDNWPIRLKLAELAALMSMGNKNEFNAWLRLVKRRYDNGVKYAAVSTLHGVLRTSLLPSGLAVRKKSCRTKDGNQDFLTVSAQDFADFLKQVERQPSECILEWFAAFGVAWPIYELQAEAVADDGAGSQEATEPASAKVIQVNSNEFEFSGLLHKPSDIDDWFEAIDVMTKAFYNLHNAMPTKAQAWTQLSANPPIGYGIESASDNLSLTMTGVIKAFNKRSFNRRWAKYTAKSNPFKPN